MEAEAMGLPKMLPPEPNCWAIEVRKAEQLPYLAAPKVPV